MPDHERQPENALWEAFEQGRPRILGALLDAVSAALWRISQVKLDRPPCMADFVKWVTAAKPGLGWDEDTFLSVYRDNRRCVSESAFEADSVALPRS
jgi:putative DNA primase/helicase